MSALVVPIKATRPQAEFYMMEKRFRLFCAGYGAGKSEAMAQSAINDARHSSDALIACYAPTYDLIRLITAPRISEKLSELGIRHTHNKSENVIYTSTSGLGDIILRTLDNPERIVGYEAYRSHMDELDTLDRKKAETAWNKAIGRNRQKPKGIEKPRNQVSAYTTPEGFGFVYDRWVVKGGSDYGMVQAPSYSNPFLDFAYIDSLYETYTDQLADAYVEGKFVNLASGTVYHKYNRRTNMSRETIQEHDHLLVGQDFNVGKMASTIYVRRPSGFHAVEEIVDAYDTPELIRILKERFPEHRIAIYPDASGNSRHTVGATGVSKSDISLLESAGFTVRAKKKNPLIKDRVLAVNKALEDEKLWVNEQKCPVTARCLEQQSYKNGVPDKSGDDHQNDATGYPIVYELPVVKPMWDVPVAFAS